MIRITELVHQRIVEMSQQYQHQSVIIIDATAGNGYDTLFLAQQFDVSSQIIAIDLQATAIATTRSRIVDASLQTKIKYHLSCHSQVEKLLPKQSHGKVLLAIFNLGYLPGAKHSVTTESSSTIIALDKVWQLLQFSGYLSVVTYPGHASGAVEHSEVAEWCSNKQNNGDGKLEFYQPTGCKKPPPAWFWLQKISQ